MARCVNEVGERAGGGSPGGAGPTSDAVGAGEDGLAAAGCRLSAHRALTDGRVAAEGAESADELRPAHLPTTDCDRCRLRSARQPAAVRRRQPPGPLTAGDAARRPPLVSGPGTTWSLARGPLGLWLGDRSGSG